MVAETKKFSRAASSPHTRGLPPLAVLLDGAVGIIPAHAGFTPANNQDVLNAMHHPRTRGVYAATAGGGLLIGASSPHTRGLPPHEPHLPVAGGIIPAHAGFTDRRSGRT